MEAVHTSESSVYYNKATRHYIPESYHLHYTMKFGRVGSVSILVWNINIIQASLDQN
jgi:hypothetical protein